ncbi:hypothetical protein BIW11_08916 [Tropilaelaps mercedesae]|uniref:Uncharacterized protein n=1 Tax=Tropilaelaps mercedesae TaxID=418985 RepID=A0A1V9XMC8_9ACAR|nr:hypothetical protein BIW11_08916 [Tropilaelaps mercedesae]
MFLVMYFSYRVFFQQFVFPLPVIDYCRINSANKTNCSLRSF